MVDDQERHECMNVSSSTGSYGYSRRKGHKMVVVVVVIIIAQMFIGELCN